MSSLPPLSEEERVRVRERARCTTVDERMAWVVSAQRLEAELRAARGAAGLPVTPREWEEQVRVFADGG